MLKKQLNAGAKTPSFWHSADVERRRMAVRSSGHGPQPHKFCRMKAWLGGSVSLR